MSKTAESAEIYKKEGANERTNRPTDRDQSDH